MAASSSSTTKASQCTVSGCIRMSAASRLWSSCRNLRLSRQTELSASFPLHIVYAWMGNTTAVAAEHYLEVLDEDFDRATQSGALSGAVVVHFPVQQGSALNRVESQNQ